MIGVVGRRGGGIAWQLAKRGHRVTLIEQGPAPNPIAASFDQHRLARRIYAEQPHYARLMDEAYAAWEIPFDKAACHMAGLDQLIAAK